MVAFPGLDFTRKEMTMVGSRASVDCFPESLELIAARQDPLSGDRDRLRARTRRRPSSTASRTTTARLHKAIFLKEPA